MYLIFFYPQAHSPDTHSQTGFRSVATARQQTHGQQPRPRVCTHSVRALSAAPNSAAIHSDRGEFATACHGCSSVVVAAMAHGSKSAHAWRATEAKVASTRPFHWIGLGVSTTRSEIHCGRRPRGGRERRSESEVRQRRSGDHRCARAQPSKPARRRAHGSAMQPAQRQKPRPRARLPRVPTSAAAIVLIFEYLA